MISWGAPGDDRGNADAHLRFCSSVETRDDFTLSLLGGSRPDIAGDHTRASARDSEPADARRTLFFRQKQQANKRDVVSRTSSSLLLWSMEKPTRLPPILCVSQLQENDVHSYQCINSLKKNVNYVAGFEAKVTRAKSTQKRKGSNLDLDESPSRLLHSRRR